MSLKAPTDPYFFLSMFDRNVYLGMLRQGNTGEQIMTILDMIADDIAEANIQDCAEHYAAISTPTLQPIAF